MFRVEDATWAMNKFKVSRAISMLRAQNLEVTEDSVRALYVRLGGAILGDESTFHGATEATKLLFESTEAYQQALEQWKQSEALKNKEYAEDTPTETPKRRGRKPKEPVSEATDVASGN